jgi:hypothetical protein
MDNYTELYIKYKKAVNIQETYNNKNNDDNFIICSCCGMIVNFNGVCSHSKIHPIIIEDKLNYMKFKYNFYDKSIYSDKLIKYTNITRKNKYIVVCDSLEYRYIKNYIYK